MKPVKRISIFAVIVGVISIVVILQMSLDYEKETRKELHEQIIYLPSTGYAKLVSFGFDNAVADYLYLWSIQFFSEKYDKARFRIIGHVYNFVTELDPKYVEAYRVGAMIMVKDVYIRHRVEEAKEMAINLYDKGIKNNPDDWILPFEAAITAHFDFKMPEKAHEYYTRALRSKGLPEIYRKRILTSIGNTLENFNQKDALSYWYNLWQTADDEVVTNIAYAHFYDLKIDMDIDFYLRAIRNYTNKYGTRPGKLTDLYRIIPKLRADPNGLLYLYDATTGEVKPPRGYILKSKRGG